MVANAQKISIGNWCQFWNRKAWVFFKMTSPKENDENYSKQKNAIVGSLDILANLAPWMDVKLVSS